MSVRPRDLEIIREVKEQRPYPPVLFLGSGFTQRYFNGPNWSDLLREIHARSKDPNDFSYLLQKCGNDLALVATALQPSVFEFAWREGREAFPEHLFQEGVDPNSFIKFMACQIVYERVSAAAGKRSNVVQAELDTLKSISPMAVITTNFDECLEEAYPGHQKIVGKDVYRHNIDSIGEIYKIHGSLSDPDTLVLTSEDYAVFEERRKYIAAKLITLFAENPVFIFGYSLGDQNVKKLICDIGEVIADGDGFIPNIVYVEWNPDRDAGAPQAEVFTISSGARPYTVRLVTTDTFEEIFQILAEPSPLGDIKPSLVKTFMTKVHKFVRSELPEKVVEFSYDDLQRVCDADQSLPKLLGFGLSVTPLSHPYILSEVGDKLGISGQKLRLRTIKKLKDEQGIDLQAKDNRYCVASKFGRKGRTSLYSQDFVDLARAMLKGEQYKVDL